VPFVLTGFDNIIPYFYPIYFAILLIHRDRRDEHMCYHKVQTDTRRMKYPAAGHILLRGTCLPMYVQRGLTLQEIYTTDLTQASARTPLCRSTVLTGTSTRSRFLTV